MILLLLALACSSSPPPVPEDVGCRDKSFSMGGMGGMGYMSAECRPDQVMTIDREDQNRGARFEDEARVTLVVCTCIRRPEVVTNGR